MVWYIFLSWSVGYLGLGTSCGTNCPSTIEYSTVVGGVDNRLNNIVLPNIIANTVTKQIIDVAVLFEQTIAIKVNIDAKAILNNKTITNSSKNFPISICIFPNRGIPIQAVIKSNNKTQNTDITDIQTSSNVIIAGTQKKRGKDDFWPRAEENLLKAFEFYFLENKIEQNTLTDIYKMIASGDIEALDNLFRSLPKDSPARMSYNVYATGSDTIKASVLTGLGTRLQAFQNKDLQELTNATDIDLVLPAKRPCIYYVISSDVDSSKDFIVSLFFTFLFIKLVKYADSKEDGKCENEVYFFLDEFANIRYNSEVK